MIRPVSAFWSRLKNFLASIISGLKLGLSAAKDRMSRGREYAKNTLTKWRITVLVWWYRHQLRAFLSLGTIGCFTAAILLSRYWLAIDSYLSNLEKSVISEPVIGIGAAITGIIAIAFSLSLFAIQQVADRGTPATVQAYARDRLLKAIYWVLVMLAMTSFAAALLKSATTHRTVAVVTGLLSLFLSFILLNFHFRRVIKFSDPRYTVSRFYKQGEEQLKRLQMLRASIVPKRNATSRK